jgi:nitrite reductase/ring-hydroxylating ferredoxin subunit
LNGADQRIDGAAFVAAARLDELREGFMTVAEVEGLPVVLTNVEGTVRAFDGTCTHADFQFETSRLVKGCEIECPIHGARFSAADGGVVKGPADVALEEFPCRVSDDGNVLVSIP